MDASRANDAKTQFKAAKPKTAIRNHEFGNEVSKSTTSINKRMAATNDMTKMQRRPFRGAFLIRSLAALVSPSLFTYTQARLTPSET